MAVATAPTSGNERDLLVVCNAPSQRRMWQGAMETARANGRTEGVEACAEQLVKLPEVSALDALRANRALVELLTGRRWIAMQQAREEGATWEQIGAALGMTRQGARDWYRRKIGEQEQYVPFHDAERARAVLEDDTDPGERAR